MQQNKYVVGLRDLLGTVRHDGGMRRQQKP